MLVYFFLRLWWPTSQHLRNFIEKSWPSLPDLGHWNGALSPDFGSQSTQASFSRTFLHPSDVRRVQESLQWKCMISLILFWRHKFSQKWRPAAARKIWEPSSPINTSHTLPLPVKLKKKVPWGTHSRHSTMVIGAITWTGRFGTQISVAKKKMSWIQCVSCSDPIQQSLFQFIYIASSCSGK